MNELGYSCACPYGYLLESDGMECKGWPLLFTQLLCILYIHVHCLTLDNGTTVTPPPEGKSYVFVRTSYQ